MITTEFRPRTFSEMVGQPLVKKVLKAIVKSPQQAPRSIILEGGFGTGKTSSARIFARALNCSSVVDGDACGKCSSCRQEIGSSPYYLEYDAAVMGNVDKIRELRDTFYYSVPGLVRVVVFDETHLISRQGQSALLKVIEESPSGVFFLFCSTDVDKLLPTIRSRSLELHFDLVSANEIVDNLSSIASKRGVVVSSQMLWLIARRSRGHVRDAHMLLDKLLLIGEKDFVESVRSSVPRFLEFVSAISRKDKQQAFQALSALQTFPLEDLRLDFQQVILELVHTLVGYKSYGQAVDELVRRMGPDVLKLARYSMSDWVQSSFSSDLAFQACFLSLFQLMTHSSTEGGARDSVVGRAMKG